MNHYYIIGATYIDINTVVVSGEGKKIKFETTSNIGGKGYNVVKGLKLFVKDTTFHTFLAKDVFGVQVIDNLKELGCSLTPESVVEGVTTPICTIVNNQNGVLLFEKSDTSVFSKFTDTQIPGSVTDIVLFSHTSKQNFKLAQTHKNLYNSKIYLSVAGSKDIPNLIQHLDFVDVLFANRKETDTLLTETGFVAIHEMMSHYSITEFISTQDKDGANVYFLDENQIIQKSMFNNYTGYNEPILNTVGAGDALVSAYIASREYFSPTQSLEKALKVTALHIRNKFSSLQSLPSDL